MRLRRRFKTTQSSPERAPSVDRRRRVLRRFGDRVSQVARRLRRGADYTYLRKQLAELEGTGDYPDHYLAHVWWTSRQRVDAADEMQAWWEVQTFPTPRVSKSAKRLLDIRLSKVDTGAGALYLPDEVIKKASDRHRQADKYVNSTPPSIPGVDLRAVEAVRQVMSQAYDGSFVRLPEFLELVIIHPDPPSCAYIEGTVPEVMPPVRHRMREQVNIPHHLLRNPPGKELTVAVGSTVNRAVKMAADQFRQSVVESFAEEAMRVAGEESIGDIRNFWSAFDAVVVGRDIHPPLEVEVLSVRALGRGVSLGILGMAATVLVDGAHPPVEYWYDAARDCVTFEFEFTWRVSVDPTAVVRFSRP